MEPQFDNIRIEAKQNKTKKEEIAHICMYVHYINTYHFLFLFSDGKHYLLFYFVLFCIVLFRFVWFSWSLFSLLLGLFHQLCDAQ